MNQYLTRRGLCQAPLKLSELLEQPQSLVYYSVTGNGKRDSLKNTKIGQSAAKRPIGAKVQRPSRKGVGPSGPKCSAPRNRVKIWSHLAGDCKQPKGGLGVMNRGEGIVDGVYDLRRDEYKQIFEVRPGIPRSYHKSLW